MFAKMSETVAFLLVIGVLNFIAASYYPFYFQIYSLMMITGLVGQEFKPFTIQAEKIIVKIIPQDNTSFNVTVDPSRKHPDMAHFIY